MTNSTDRRYLGPEGVVADESGDPCTVDPVQAVVKVISEGRGGACAAVVAIERGQPPEVVLRQIPGEVPIPGAGLVRQTFQCRCEIMSP